MPNDTSCSPFGNCTILSGAITNGTLYVTQFDPTKPAPWWHQRMELITICVCNSLSLLVIVSRIWYRVSKLKRFRGDDRWMAFAAFILMPFWASQIGSNLYGSGLYAANVPHDWRPIQWYFTFGWVGYFMVVTSIKLSVCFCFLQILSDHQKTLKYWVYGLCTLIACLGLTLIIASFTNCYPFISNFDWYIRSNYCINFDIFRYLWIAVSIPIDIAIMSVPLQFLRRLKLRDHERLVLKLVFCATLLGTITCIIGIYSAYDVRTENQNEGWYNETPWIMMNDVEILMYTLGASFPVLSRFIVQKAEPRSPQPIHEQFSSWAKYVPNFFPSGTISSETRTKLRADTTDETMLNYPGANGDVTTRTCTGPDLKHKRSGGGGKERDLEKENGVRVETEVMVLREGEGEGEGQRETPKTF